jgi:hypothetical protein
MYGEKTARDLMWINAASASASFSRRDPAAERGRGTWKGDDLTAIPASLRPGHGLKFGSKELAWRALPAQWKGVAYVRAQQHARLSELDQGAA